jgi:hypothetical protein
MNNSTSMNPSSAPEAAIDPKPSYPFLKQARDARYRPDAPPPPEEPTLLINGVPVCHPGNLSAIVSGPKRCKSTFLSGAIAALLGAPEGTDLMGWSSPETESLGEMKTLFTLIILVGTLGWGPASEIICYGQGNVALANASTINRAAQLAAVTGKPFPAEAQDVTGILDQLHGLGYLTELDRQKIERSKGLLQPVRAFNQWRDVEFALSSR